MASAQIPLYNGGSGRQTQVVSELNSTIATVGGKTVYAFPFLMSSRDLILIKKLLRFSPQAFYLFPTAKIIKVPAVTDSLGQLACATTSSESLICTSTSLTGCPSNTNIKTIGSPYYSSFEREYQDQCHTILSTSLLSVNVFPGINTYAEAYFESPSVPTKTAALPPMAVWNYSVISFSTPFVYLPLRGAQEGIDGDAEVWLIQNPDIPSTVQKRGLAPATTYSIPNDGANEDFGYVPQALIDWMAANPDYSKQYPGLASCVPGGPPISPSNGCFAQAAPATAEPVPDLTLNSTLTVQGVGCFHPGKCAAAQPTADNNQQIAATAAAIATTREPVKTPGPKSNFQQAAKTQASLAAEANMAKASQIAAAIKSIKPQIPQSPEGSLETDTPKSPQDLGSQQSSSLPTASPSATLIYPQSHQTSILASASAEGGVTNSTPPKKANNNPSLVLVAGTHTLTPLPSSTAFLLSSSTLTPGGTPVIISGTTFSLPPNPTALVVNDVTSPLSPQPAAAAPTPTPNLASLIMAGFGPASPANKASPTPSPFFIPEEGKAQEETLTPGAPAVIVSGTTYSLAPSATDVVINGITSLLPSLTPVTAGGQQTEQEFDLVLAGQTLVPGAPAIIIDSVLISLPRPTDSNAIETAVIVAGTTEGISSVEGQGPVVTIGAEGVRGSFVPAVGGSASASAGVGGGTNSTNATAGVLPFVPGSGASTARITKVGTKGLWIWTTVQAIGFAMVGRWCV